MLRPRRQGRGGRSADADFHGCRATPPRRGRGAPRPRRHRRSCAALLAILVASAAAFASASESEIGVQAPLRFYDPLGFLDWVDQETFDRFRYTELKHGRISQLAFLGQITTRAGLHLPGDINLGRHVSAYFLNGLVAINGPDAISTAGLLQITALVAILKIRVMTDITRDSEFLDEFRNGFNFV